MTDLPQDILLLSTADWDNPFWTNKQHTAQRLAQRGFRVLYVDSLGLRKPTLSSRDFGRIARRLQRALRSYRAVQTNLCVHSPLVLPAHGHERVDFFNRELLQRRLRRLMRRLGFSHPIVWTYNPMSVDLIAELKPALTVYHCVDDLAAQPGLPSQAIREHEARLVQSADLTFTTSPALQERLQAERPGHVHFFPNVVDADHFGQARFGQQLPADLEAIGRPRLGFIGAISDYKVDFDLIRKVAIERPDWNWVLIGQVGEGQPSTSVEKLKLPNIHLLGPRPYAELPDYLRGFDVATLPMRINDYTTAMFPMKFFEYLAAGRAVVSSDLPAIVDFRHLCHWTQGSGFVAALAKALEGQGWDAEVGVATAAQYTWDKRLDFMTTLLDEQWQRR